MKSHDILGISITSDEHMIEEAYLKKIEALDKDLKKSYPQTYQRRVNELDKARQECIEYTLSSFSDKVKHEVEDCVTTQFEANRVNACCVQDCCGCCCILIGIGGVCGALCGGITVAQQNKGRKNREQIGILEKLVNDCNNQLSQKKRSFDDAHRDAEEIMKQKIPALKEQLETAQSNLETQKAINQLLEEYLSDYGCEIDLSKTGVYKSFNDEFNTLNRRIHGYRLDLDKDNKVIDEYNEIQAKRDKYNAEIRQLRNSE